MQRYFTNSKNNNNFILSNDDLHHIKNVMRMKDNTKIEIVYHNELYIASVYFNNQEIIIKEEEKIKTKITTRNTITLIVPLLKEQKMDYILQKATELQVDTIIPIALTRCIVKLDNKKEDKKIERWEKICKEAAEQSKRLTVPNITKLSTIKEILKLDGKKLICSTKIKENCLSNILPNIIKENIVFIFGPEGGFDSKEETLLIENDYIPISLGNTILRTETAPIYILSCINYEKDRI